MAQHFAWLVVGALAVAISPLAAQLQNHKTEPPNPNVMTDDAYKVQATLPRKDSENYLDVKWIVPPEPNKMSWHPEKITAVDEEGNETVLKQFEHALEVTHIKFDYEDGHEQDGMNIRWNGDESDGDLHHLGNGGGDGEYIARDDKSAANGGGVPEETEVGFSDPVLWIAGEEDPREVKIQVRIRLRKIVTPLPLAHADPGTKYRATIWAKNVFETPDQPAGFMDWNQRVVYFEDGISKEYDAAAGTFVPGASEYVIFELDDTVPNKVGDYIARYECYMKDIERWDPTQGQWIPGDHQDEVKFDALTRIDMYSALGAPSLPWNYDEVSHPWASALGFVCYACNAAGSSTLTDATDAIVTHLFSGHGVEYNHKDGESQYAFRVKKEDPPPGIPLVEGEYYQIDLKAYMRIEAPLISFYGNGHPRQPEEDEEDIKAVGCFDQAGAVTALVNLIHGGAELHRHLRFGYLNTADFVGGKKSNNPFYWNADYNPEKLLGSNPDYETDLHYYSPKVSGGRARSFFDFHAYVIINDKVVDATVGPVKLSDDSDLASYLSDVRDTSTTEEQKLRHPSFPDDAQEFAAQAILNAGVKYSLKLELAPWK